MSKHYDVIIIGGSYAGLSAALSLGRAIREVLVIDGGTPCNWQTPHAHNFLTQDGNTPAGISALGKKEVMNYPTVQFKEGVVSDVTVHDNYFKVVVGSDQVFNARKILFATGQKDLMPAIKGFADCWGLSVIHCPYCHGYEFRNQATGILMNGEPALELAKLISNWTDQLTVFTNGPATLNAEHLLQLQQMNIRVEERELQELVHENGVLKALVFKEGSIFQLNAFYARPPFEQQSALPEKLGCKFTAGGHIEVNDLQQTSIPGIYAAGDNAAAMRSVSSAVYTGNKAGAFINHELIAEKFQGN
ncbi:NAD(P)/FAD-dependent oxidoreductase [Pedobacter heparinus]|uniref:NAD(P)/FAD-dependent oxidoreductase n=1 Tax=Pedobacter heparinus TaxID=984 RepID=UPI00292FE651|nr:NAD(P)/FAD-dependent oxidoreductase [Pedobacter heparinus]